MFSGFSTLFCHGNFLLGLLGWREDSRVSHSSPHWDNPIGPRQERKERHIVREKIGSYVGGLKQQRDLRQYRKEGQGHTKRIIRLQFQYRLNHEFRALTVGKI
jgi:hypothetical protein